MVTIFLRHYVFGIAITWGLLLLLMHDRLLAQYGENEKKAVSSADLDSQNRKNYKKIGAETQFYYRVAQSKYLCCKTRVIW